jgi:hypothetical protein
MAIMSVSTVAEVAMAPAMISPWMNRLWPLAELIEIEKADQQGEEPREVEHHDPAGKARRGAQGHGVPQALEVSPGAAAAGHDDGIGRCRTGVHP